MDSNEFVVFSHKNGDKQSISDNISTNTEIFNAFCKNKISDLDKTRILHVLGKLGDIICMQIAVSSRADMIVFKIQEGKIKSLEQKNKHYMFDAYKYNFNLYMSHIPADILRIIIDYTVY